MLYVCYSTHKTKNTRWLRQILKILGRHQKNVTSSFLILAFSHQTPNDVKKIVLFLKCRSYFFYKLAMLSEQQDAEKRSGGVVCQCFWEKPGAASGPQSPGAWGSNNGESSALLTSISTRVGVNSLQFVFNGDGI